MPRLALYDTESSTSMSIPIAVTDYNAINNIVNGTSREINYKTVTAIVRSYSYGKEVLFTASGGGSVIYSQIEDWVADICNAFNIPLTNFGASDVKNYISNNSYKLIKPSGSTSDYLHPTKSSTSTLITYSLGVKSSSKQETAETFYMTIDQDAYPRQAGRGAYVVYSGAPDAYGGAVYGAVVFATTISNSPNFALRFLIYPSLNLNDYQETQATPGDKGFRPTGAYTDKNNPGIGGWGTTQKKDPDYASDTVTQPGAPDESVASAVKSGFINCYKMTQTEINKICSALYSDTLMDAIKNIIVNPLDFIVSLMVFPVSPSTGASENLKFGKWNAALTGATALGVDVTGNRLSNQFKTIDMGTVDIPENWGNFLDYSQTSIELYLPFIGSVNIDVSECMGGTINVQYTIDFFTGMCVANVLCTKTVTLPSGKVLLNKPAQHSFQGNCAIQIPLSAENYGSMVGSLINACTQGITNPVAGFAGIAQDAITGGFRPNITSKGNIVANAGFCSVLYPYVRITRPITAEPESYQEVMGYPSYIDGSLSTCSGLCICDDINLKGITGATESELNKIRQLCKDGIYV